MLYSQGGRRKQPGVAVLYSQGWLFWTATHDGGLKVVEKVGRGLGGAALCGGDEAAGGEGVHGALDGVAHGAVAAEPGELAGACSDVVVGVAFGQGRELEERPKLGFLEGWGQVG